MRPLLCGRHDAVYPTAMQGYVGGGDYLRGPSPDGYFRFLSALWSACSGSFLSSVIGIGRPRFEIGYGFPAVERLCLVLVIVMLGLGGSYVQVVNLCVIACHFQCGLCEGFALSTSCLFPFPQFVGFCLLPVHRRRVVTFVGRSQLRFDRYRLVIFGVDLSGYLHLHQRLTRLCQLVVVHRCRYIRYGRAGRRRGWFFRASLFLVVGALFIFYVAGVKEGSKGG